MTFPTPKRKLIVLGVGNAKGEKPHPSGFGGGVEGMVEVIIARDGDDECTTTCSLLIMVDFTAIFQFFQNSITELKSKLKKYYRKRARERKTTRLVVEMIKKEIDDCIRIGSFELRDEGEDLIIGKLTDASG